MDTTFDRRKRTRLPLCLPAAVKRLGSSQTAEANTLNVSCLGIYLESNTPFAVSERLEIRVLLGNLFDPGQDSAVLRCHGRVVRVDADNSRSACGFACQIEDYTLETTSQEPVESLEKDVPPPVLAY